MRFFVFFCLSFSFKLEESQTSKIGSERHFFNSVYFWVSLSVPKGMGHMFIDLELVLAMWLLGLTTAFF